MVDWKELVTKESEHDDIGRHPEKVEKLHKKKYRCRIDHRLPIERKEEA